MRGDCSFENNSDLNAPQNPSIDTVKASVMSELERMSSLKVKVTSKNTGVSISPE